MLGFIVGSVAGLLSLIESRILIESSIVEIIVVIIYIAIYYGCFGAMIDYIIQLIQEIKK